MPNSYIRSLPDEVQRQLRVCGITTDAQLAAGQAATLSQEIQSAKEFFPEERLDLTESDLSHFIRKAIEINGIPEKLQEALPTVKPIAAIERQFKAQVEGIFTESTAASAEAKTAAETEKFQQKLKSAGQNKTNKRAITCGHPILLLCGAFATILVPLFVASLIGLPYMLMASDYRPLGDDEFVYLLIEGLLILPYLLLVRNVHCSVCHIHVFTFRRYQYHSKAHRLPLLGVPITTALKIIFSWSYTCPACGTPQKLFGKRSNHRHSHRA